MKNPNLELVNAREDMILHFMADNGMKADDETFIALATILIANYPDVIERFTEVIINDLMGHNHEDEPIKVKIPH